MPIDIGTKVLILSPINVGNFGAHHHTTEMRVLMLDSSPLWARSLINTVQCFKHCNAELIYSKQRPTMREDNSYDVIFWDTDNITWIRLEEIMEQCEIQHGKTPYLVAVVNQRNEHQLRAIIDANPPAIISREIREFEVQQLLRCLHSKKRFIQQNLLAEIRSLQRTLALEGDVLTTREKKVLKLVCSNYSNLQIAENLSLSPETIKKHRKNINAKIEAQNPLEYLAFAFRTGLICPTTWAKNHKEQSLLPHESILHQTF